MNTITIPFKQSMYNTDKATIYIPIDSGTQQAILWDTLQYETIKMISQYTGEERYFDCERKLRTDANDLQFRYQCYIYSSRDLYDKNATRVYIIVDLY